MIVSAGGSARPRAIAAQRLSKNRAQNLAGDGMSSSSLGAIGERAHDEGQASTSDALIPSL